jgi:curved DNA-binding protein CbpA
MPETDHYLTLDIKYNASNEEIKQAFRRMAKKFHPDKNPGDEKKAEKQFKKIMDAYKILSNPKSKENYDKKLKLKQNKNDVMKKRRENLRKKAKESITHRCQLILFELTNQNSQQALEIYDTLVSERPYFSFDQYISDPDIRDCEFLLGEAYHRKGELWEAARFYERVLEREKKKAYFRGFAQEIKSLLKDVYLQLIIKAGTSEQITLNIKKLLTLELSNNEIAQAYKKAAEAYYCINELANAKKALEYAFQLKPKLTGAKKICRKLGLVSV